MELEKGLYYLVDFKPYPQAFWVNKMGIIYSYSLTDKDFIFSGLSSDLFSESQILIKSPTAQNLITRQARAAFIWEVKELVSIPWVIAKNTCNKTRILFYNIWNRTKKILKYLN